MQDETILCLSPRLWNSLWRDTQQIMSRLASNNRVVFVEPQRDSDVSYLADIRQRWRYFGSLSIKGELPNLEVVRTPPALPYFRRHLPSALLQYLVPLITWLNFRLMLWHLKRVTKRLRVHQPILWLYSPRQLDLIGYLNEKLVCYYNYDELADFAANARIRQLLLEYDERLCSLADVVFATSRAQYRRRKPLNPHTHYVPNGVDYPLFSRALDPDTEIPPQILALPRPIAGFVGWLGFHIDVGLLVALSQEYPHTSFVLVGPDAVEKDHLWNKLRSQQNVWFIGRKRRRELPGFLKAFDAALMPWVVKGHILSAYPLKLHEYLAAGRSIVATDLPELEPYASVIRIAKTQEAFIQLLPEAIADNAPHRVRERTNLARRNSWSRRVSTIHQILDARLSANSHPLPETRNPQRSPLIGFGG